MLANPQKWTKCDRRIECQEQNDHGQVPFWKPGNIYLLCIDLRGQVVKCFPDLQETPDWAPSDGLLQAAIFALGFMTLSSLFHWFKASRQLWWKNMKWGRQHINFLQGGFSFRTHDQKWCGMVLYGCEWLDLTGFQPVSWDKCHNSQILGVRPTEWIVQWSG